MKVAGLLFMAFFAVAGFVQKNIVGLPSLGAAGEI